jgi:hypothetical protein
MPRTRHLPLLLLSAAIAGALSASSAFAASSSGSGTVLSLRGHTVRLVDRAHRVGDVRVNSTRGLRRGDVVRVQNSRARVSGHARRLSFLGRVVRSSRRTAVVRLGDGSTFKLSGPRTPGETLLITIATGRRADAVVAVKSVRGHAKPGGEGGRGAPGDDACEDDEASVDDDACGGDVGAEDDDWSDEVDGTVTALADDRSSLTIALEDGSGEATYPVDDPSLLDEIAVGDDVALYLDEDGTAIDVEPLELADDPGPGDDNGGEDE